MGLQLEEYITKQEIKDLLFHRARGADRFDTDLMKTCHAPGGTDNHGSFVGSAHAFIDSIADQQDKGPKCYIKLHIVDNILIDINGDEAFAESYHVAHETFSEKKGVTDYRIAGRYLDSFRKIDSRWCISHRDVIYDWSRKSPATQSFWDNMGYTRHLQGSRDLKDPLYRAHPSARGMAPHPFMADQQGLKAMNTTDSGIQKLLDRQEISEMLYRRARAGDRADVALAHSCYHPGATERHGDFDGFAADFIDNHSLTGVGDDENSPLKSMFHFITNIIIDFEGPDAAFVESYHVAIAEFRKKEGIIDATIGGRYLDRFTKENGKWAIKHRDVIFDWSRLEPETDKYWDKFHDAAFLFGKRGQDDPLYQYVKRGV